MNNQIYLISNPRPQFTTKRAMPFFKQNAGNWALLVGASLITNPTSLDATTLTNKADSQGFPVPSYSTIYKANTLIEEIEIRKGQLEHINPSEDGGIVIEFLLDRVYHMLDVSNDGEVHLLVRRQPKTTIDNITEGYREAFVREIG